MVARSRGCKFIALGLESEICPENKSGKKAQRALDDVVKHLGFDSREDYLAALKGLQDGIFRRI